MTEPNISGTPINQWGNTLRAPGAHSLPPLPPRNPPLGGRDRAVDLRRQPGASARIVAELDPAQIVESRWVSTTARDWHTSDFASLKHDIYATEGNVQPIKVRPAEHSIATKCPSVKADATAKFEIVFGHLRHRACFELGLPILCVVESMHDAQLVKEFIVENLQTLP